MNTEAVITKLGREIRKLSARDNQPEHLKDRLKNAEDLDFLLEAGPVVCSLFNHVTFRYDYISPNVEQMLGTKADELIRMPYQKFLRTYLHPDDLGVIGTKLFPDIVNFTQKHAGTYSDSISVHYNYRMVTAARDWIKIEQRTSPIKINKEGKILLDQSFYMQKGQADHRELHPMKLSIFVTDANGRYDLRFSRTYSPNEMNGKKVTKREMDVLQLLARGKSSNEIGQKLNIGETTVITHRRNMLRKFDLSNTSELIAFAFKLGILKS